MTALIELVCRTHKGRATFGPLITLVDGVWAYCEEHGQDGHDWTRIEPTRRELLGDLTEMPERRAS